MEQTIAYSFELGPIRPPSEAYSLLIRATMNCSWNRCKFCNVYKGRKFQLRPVEDIKRDIKMAKLIHDKVGELSWRSGCRGRVRDVAGMMLSNPLNEAFRNVALWLYAGGESAFLQDANSLIMRTNELAEVVAFLRETFPGIKRVTSYARSKTAAKKGLDELMALREAGLSRIHIGLESGYNPLLQYMDKGVTAAEHVRGGKNVVEAGLSLSEYVVLGLGGKKMWREHAIYTARVLNEINPDFIRVRTLNVTSGMLLRDEVESGNFARATDEEILEEERLLIEHLECRTSYVSDHIGNLLQEIEGELPQDKEKMLAVIDRFQALPSEERTNFKVGRRVGIYARLDDLYDATKHQAVEQVVHRISQGGTQVDESVIYALMKDFM